MPLKICKLDAEDEVVAELAIGSHIVGRGPVLKCSDKRISRNHATINVEENLATITPIHVNPCYHMAANSKTVRILPHQQETLLQDGDKFGLLPDACWFKVKYVHADEGYEEIINKSPMKRLCEDESDENGCKRLKLEVEPAGSVSEEQTMNEPTIKAESDHDEQLMDSGAAIEFPLEVAEEYNAEVDLSRVEGDDVGISDGNGMTEVSEVEEEKIDVTENEVKQENVGDPETGHENIEMKQENPVDNDVKQENTVDNEVKPENIRGNEAEVGSENLDPQPSTSSNQEPNDGEDKKEKDTKDQATGTDAPKPKREKCWYGASCYRKNPAHRADLRHPGDSDYLSDSEDDRPTCSYGAQCYRKNKLHRQSYKHPPRQRPQKYGRGQRRRDNGNQANPNDDFIDSDEDDMQGDFSDGSSDNYEPPSDVDSDETDWTSSQDLNSQDLTTGKKNKK